MLNNKLLGLRRAIDRIDAKILEQLELRSKIVSEIASLRVKNQVYDSEREQEICQRMVAQNKSAYPPEAIAQIYRLLCFYSRQLQFRQSQYD